MKVCLSDQLRPRYSRWMMSERTLYSGVADWIVECLTHGTFRVGDRVPSIRALSANLGVSMNTVREAYALLERRRYLECRPQSGYFVRMSPSHTPTMEASHPASMDPRKVVFCRIYGAFRERLDSASAALAVAAPDPVLLPTQRVLSCIADAMRRKSDRVTDYCMVPGLRALREQTARISVDAGAAFDPEEIVITTGCSEAVFLALMATCRAGDTIAVESPIYFNFLETISELGLQVLEIPSSPTEGMSVDALRFALAHHTISACLTIPSYSNPSGSLMSEAKKRELAELTAEHGVPLIEDDIYGELPFSGSRPPSCKSFDKTGNVIYCSSFSKTLGPGLRLGWIAPGKWYERVERLKSLMSVGNPSLEQYGIAAFLEHGGYERHLRTLRSALAERVADMRALVTATFPEGTRISAPAGGLLLWVELPDPCDSERLYAACVREDILFPPGSLFSASGGFKRHLRLNASAAGPEVEKAVRRIGELARSIQA